MIIEEICKKHEILGLILFGSAVQNLQTAGEVDLCNLRKKPLDQTAYFDCLQSFSEYFNKEKVDLVFWSNIPSALQKEISENYKILFGNSDYVLDFINAGERIFGMKKNTTIYCLLK